MIGIILSQQTVVESDCGEEIEVLNPAYLRLSLGAALTVIASASIAQTPDPSGAEPPAVQDAPAAVSDSSAADIVVTAQRRAQRLQDVPISVTVTSGEAVRNAGTVDLVDLSQRMPGIKLSTDPQSNHIHIRGVGSGLNAGFEQSVGTFIDGVYRARSRSIQAGLFDVERIEVLNGPQTIFFGNNTVAGAVNVTTKKPSATFGLDAQLLYSPSDDQYLAQAGVTGPLAEGLSGRIAVQFSGMNGYIRNENLKLDEPRLRDFVGRASLHFEAGAYTSDLRVDHARNRDRGTYSAEITGCPPPPGYPAARGPCLVYLNSTGGLIDNELDFHSIAGPSAFRLDMTEVAWTNRFDFGGVSLNLITSYNDQKSRTFLNATPIPARGVAGYYYSPFSQNETYKLFAQEVRLESNTDSWLQYVVGGYYSHGKLVSNSYSSLFGSPAIGGLGAPVTSTATPISTNRNLYQTDQTRSVFGQLTASVAEGLKINAGLRYTSVKKDASRIFLVGIGGPTADPADFIVLDAATQAKIVTAAGGSITDFADPHTTYDKLMPSFGVQYELNPATNFYATYTKGFKAGGYSDSNGPAQFDSEGVNAYEIGVKGSAFSRKVFYTFDVFLENFTGLQQALTVIGPTGASVTTVGNAASAVSKGAEASLSIRPASFLSINLSGAYIDSHFKDYSNAGCTVLQVVTIGATCTQDLSGRPTPFSPKWSGTAGATLTIPAGGDNSVRVDPNLFLSTGYFLSPVDDPIVHQDSYAQADLRLGFGPEDRRWEVAVIGKNLNNAKVVASGSTIATSPGVAYKLLQRARSIAFSLSLKL